MSRRSARCSARVRLAYHERHLRPGGTISGPAMMALADLTLYVAILANIGPVGLAVTTNLAFNFLRKPKEERPPLRMPPPEARQAARGRRGGDPQRRRRRDRLPRDGHVFDPAGIALNRASRAGLAPRPRTAGHAGLPPRDLLLHARLAVDRAARRFIGRLGRRRAPRGMAARGAHRQRADGGAERRLDAPVFLSLLPEGKVAR